MTTVAVMQPYFFPYTGYFRLFAAADLFVVYDCVQFPRRGYVHRNRLPDRAGKLDWLTLPLCGCPRDTRIMELAFAPLAEHRFIERMQKFPSLRRLNVSEFLELRNEILDFNRSTVEYLIALLTYVRSYFNLTTKIIRSSTLSVQNDFRGTERVLEICRLTGARRYVNSPGGRDLYDVEEFRRRGIDLAFLPEWTGPVESVLHRLLVEPRQRLVRELTGA